MRGLVIAALVATYAIALCASAGLSSTATAQTPQEISWCEGKEGASAEQIIRGCTAIIQSGKYSGKNLSLAFRLRAHANLYAKSRPDKDAAIHDFSEAIRLNPEDGAAFYGRADALKVEAYMVSGSERKKLATSAAEDFTQAIRLRPVPLALDYINRSNAYSLSQDYERELSDLTEALRLDPADIAEALVNRCLTYGELGRWSEALADCNRSLTFNGQVGQDADRESSTLVARGYVYLRMANYKDAVADYDRALADPNTDAYHRADALFGRGFALGKLGDVGRGQADMAAAIRSRPEIARYFSERGVQ